MHVARLGLTPLKGTRHLARDAVRLGPSGPEGDRVFCLVDADPRAPQVVRTVQHPSLVAVRTSYADGVLSVTLPDGTALSATPVDDGTELKADYWGRPVLLRPQTGPHAAVLSAYLGRPVALARVETGDVVYGGQVSIVGTVELRELAAHAGRPELAHQDARFRSTLTVHAEEPLDELVAGTLLGVGAARLRVRGPLPRCAVVDLDPVTGERDAPVLAALAGYRRRAGEVWFGLDADVETAGEVRPGDAVRTIVEDHR